MGSEVLFIATEEDNCALIDYAKSIGMELVATTRGGVIPNDPADGPGCYLSVVPVAQLKPHGPLELYLDVLNPILLLIRGYSVGKYLVLGRLRWNNDNEDIARVTRPYFNKLKRWIRDNWSRPEGANYFVAPNAERLIELGYDSGTFPPGVSSSPRIIEV